MRACVVCGCEVRVPANVVRGEIVECFDCGCELEIVDLDPVELAVAPSEEEDWGQ